jgi:aspartate kinase
MAGETDRLLALGRSVSASARDMDVIAATGEQVSVGLMAAALQSSGVRARPLLGHQLPIRTNGVFGDAEVISVATERLQACFEAGEIPVVAGFQGVARCGAVTTLGRGGSDTTAVAVASALSASCEIFTDVNGVFSIDPRLSQDAVSIPFIDYTTMGALSRAGAKVLDARSVALAMHGRVRLHVKSSFSSGLGTEIVQDSDARAADALSIAVAKAVDATVRVSVIGRCAIARMPADLEARLTRSGIATLEMQRSSHGLCVTVPEPMAILAARLLHTLFVRLSDPARAWRRARMIRPREARPDQT